MGIDDLPQIDLQEDRKRAAAKQGRHAAAKHAAAPATTQGIVKSGAPRHAAHAAGGVHIPRRRPLRTKLIAALACAVVLVGGGTAVAAATGALPFLQKPEVDTPVEAPTTIEATVKADRVIIDGPELMRGAQLTNIEPASDLDEAYAEDFYKAVFDGRVVYVEKKYVRTADDPAFEQWTGYASEDATIYKYPDFSGTNIQTLIPDEEVQVLDAFEDLLIVRNADGYEGYIPADRILKEKATEGEKKEEEKKPSSSSSSSTKPSNSGSSSSKPSGTTGGSGSSSSGSGSGSSDSGSGSGSSSSGSGSSGSDSGNAGGNAGSGNTGSGDSGNSGSGSSGSGNSGSGPADGDEMVMPTAFTLRQSEPLFGVEIAYADEVDDSVSADSTSSFEGEGPMVIMGNPGLTGVVLIDGVPTYEGVFNRGDVVTVELEPAEKPTEGYCNVVINDQVVEVLADLLRLESEPAYEEWLGYAAKDTLLFLDYTLRSPMGVAPELNDKLKVIDAIGDVLVVDRGETICYAKASEVAVEPFPEEKDEEEDEEDAEKEDGKATDSSLSSSSNSGSNSSSSKPSGSSGSSNSGSSSKPSGTTGGNSGSGSGSSGSSSSGSGSNSGSGSSSGSANGPDEEGSSGSGGSGSNSGSSSGSGSSGSGSNAGSGSNSDSSGSDSGSSSGSGSTETTPEWTKPIL